MNIYRVSVLDFNGKGEVVSTKYVNGLTAARSAVPVKLSFCRNAGAFVGYKDGREFWAIKCK